MVDTYIQGEEETEVDTFGLKSCKYFWGPADFVIASRIAKLKACERAKSMDLEISLTPPL